MWCLHFVDIPGDIVGHYVRLGTEFEYALETIEKMRGQCEYFRIVSLWFSHDWDFPIVR